MRSSVLETTKPYGSLASSRGLMLNSKGSFRQKKFSSMESMISTKTDKTLAAGVANHQAGTSDQLGTSASRKGLTKQ